MKAEINVREIVKRARKIDPLLGEIMDYLLANVSFRFVDDEKIETAAIKLNGEPEILVGKRFWEKNVLSYEDAISVILHELLHQIAFSENSYSRGTFLDNFAQDMWINSYIARYFHLVNFFQRFYRDRIPYFLLRTPEGIDPERKSKLLQNTLPHRPQMQMQLLNLWENAYHDEISASTIKMHLIRIFGRDREFRYRDLPIIANTSAGKRIRKEMGESIKIKLEIRRERYNRNSNYFSLRGSLYESKLPDITIVRGVSSLIREIISLFQTEGNMKYKMLSRSKTYGVIPRPGRRDIIAIARGSYPFFYENEEILPDITFRDTGIYIDLSGSMEEFYKEIYYLMQKISQFISPPYFTFSTQVNEISLSEILSLHVRTTGGTDFEMVIRDAKERKLRNLIAITDGIWHINPRLARWAGKNLKTLLIIPHREDENQTIRYEKEIKKLNARVILWKI